jgi:hypothetical protein
MTKFKCVDNRGRESVLTLNKVYEGKGMPDTLYVKIFKCEDGDYGIFLIQRFEILEG